MTSIGHLPLSVNKARVVASVWQTDDVKKLSTWQQLGMEIAEIRLDLADDMDVHQAKQFCQTITAALPTILTIRTAREGGQWHKSEDERLFYYQTLMYSCSAVDIELSASTIILPVIQSAHDAQRIVIASHHNFTAPESLSSMQKSMQKSQDLGVDVFKTASLCLQDTDYNTLETFAKQCKQNNQLSVVIGMSDGTDNATAIHARKQLPQYGSCIAFASKGKNSAPGQLSIEQTVAALSTKQ